MLGHPALLGATWKVSASLWGVVRQQLVSTGRPWQLQGISEFATWCPQLEHYKVSAWLTSWPYNKRPLRLCIASSAALQQHPGASADAAGWPLGLRGDLHGFAGCRLQGPHCAVLQQTLSGIMPAAALLQAGSCRPRLCSSNGGGASHLWS